MNSKLESKHPLSHLTACESQQISGQLFCSSPSSPPGQDEMTIPRFLVVGLGNHAYPKTRHSVGYMALNHVAQSLFSEERWTLDKIVSGHIQEAFVDRPTDLIVKPIAKPKPKVGENGILEPSQPEMVPPEQAFVVFMKPKTYMNFSGGPVLQASKDIISL